ncbi:MAG: CDP-alcohol phosphatidyltransferase family protein [Planctomycetota bacterium]
MDHQRNHATLLPNLITMGNAVCGFVALTFVAGTHIEAGEVARLENLRTAAWCILLGMVFDVFDGRVARMTGGSSAIGAQLDSLADLVTFGLAPAGLLVTLNRVASTGHPAWKSVVWVFGLAYFLGAMLRLARFNVEHSPDEEDHLCFKGLPTPAAAGVVAGLVLVFFWLKEWKSWELRAIAETAPAFASAVQGAIPALLPFLAFFLGFAMVSNRFKYQHIASGIVARKQSFDTFVYLVFGLILAVVMVEPIICLVFLGYLFWTPASRLLGTLRRSPRPGGAVE